MTAKVVAEKSLTPHEIREYESQYSQLHERLGSAKEALASCETVLHQVLDAEEKAARFLKLSEQVEGFGNERIKAQEVLDDCVNRRAEIEPRIQNRKRQVSQIQAELSLIPRATLVRQLELRELARQLSSL
jgi:hypothetical protein